MLIAFVIYRWSRMSEKCESTWPGSGPKEQKGIKFSCQRAIQVPKSDSSVLLRGSNGNPNQHNYNIQPLALTTIVLERPHAILLLVPVRTRSAVHTPPSNMRLAIGSGRLGAGRDVRLFGLGFGAAAGLVEGGGGNEVLDNGAVASKLEARRRCVLRGGLGDNLLEHVADDLAVP